jgi:hypothetical protein
MTRMRRNARLQIGTIRAARDDDIGPRPRGIDLIDDSLVCALNHSQVRAPRVLARDIEKETAQSADADRPNARALRNVERRST